MSDKEMLHSLTEALDRGEPAALATVVEVKGGSPAQVGFSLLVRPAPPGSGAEVSVVGNLGGGELEQRARQEAVAALRDGRPRLVHYALREEGPDAVGAVCGGEATVFIQAYQPAPTLLIVGGGHIGRPLAEMAHLAGFQVQVVDVQAERATTPQLDPAAITPWTYVVIVTETHLSDEQALRQVLAAPAAYVGMIGSRRKVKTVLYHLRAEGISEEQLARIHAPIGLDLGGRQPAEIALSILAEIVQVRYGGTGRPLSPGTGYCRGGVSPPSG